MFAKIFEQIFDSTLANNWQHRHVFMDLLVMADAKGNVQKTPQAIHRITGVPLEMIVEALDALTQPDPDSGSPEEDGRRIVLINPERRWGWRIVNYEKYRRIRDEEARREYFREYRKIERAEKKNPKRPKPLPHESQSANGRHLKHDNKGNAAELTGYHTPKNATKED